MKKNEKYDEYCRLVSCAEEEIRSFVSDVWSIDRWPPGHEQYCELNKERINERLAWIKEDLDAAKNFWEENRVEDAMSDMGYCSSTAELAEEHLSAFFAKVRQALHEIASASDDGARAVIRKTFK